MRFDLAFLTVALAGGGGGTIILSYSLIILALIIVSTFLRAREYSSNTISKGLFKFSRR